MNSHSRRQNHEFKKIDQKLGQLDYTALSQIHLPSKISKKIGERCLRVIYNIYFFNSITVFS